MSPSLPHALLLTAVLAAAVPCMAGLVEQPRPAQLRLVKLPGRNDSPIFQDGLPRAEAAAPVQRKKFFGLGVGFQGRPGPQGIALEQVVAGSPADRAGLAAGTIIVEINGDSTLGRSGEDCTHMVRDAGNSVTIKYFDPATLKLRTRTLEKEWFLLPNTVN